MDQLTALQSKTGTAMVNLVENIKKEPKDRRTANLIEKRTQELEQLWMEFETRHNEILSYNQPEHKYFQSNYYDKIVLIANQGKNVLTSYTAAIKPGHSGPEQQDENLEKNDNKSTAGKMDDENKLRIRKLQLRIEACRQQLSEISSEEFPNVVTIEFYIKEISESFKSLQQIHEEALIHATEESDREIRLLSNEFHDLKRQYQTTIITLENKKNCLDITPAESDIRLPRLSIPIFDGKYESWVAFRDIFVRLIHSNKRLASIEKMQYLKTNTKGEAHKLISHLDISDVNYEAAWSMLNERFNNKRKLVLTQIQTLFQLPKMDTESSNGIKRIHDTVKECLHAISNLGVDITSWAPLIIHLVLQKVDFETLRLFEQSLQQPKEIPTFETIYRFLETRFQTLESLSEVKKKETLTYKPGTQKPNFSSRPLKSYHMVSEQRCIWCSKSHSIYNCPQFKSLSVPKRLEEVTSKKLCVNCLSHSSKERCYSRFKCSICQRRHHSLLHEDKPSSSSIVQNNYAGEGRQVLLATALIKATASNGREELLRALIDSGSQASFITENAVQILSLPRTKTYAQVSGIGATDPGRILGKVDVKIRPRFPSSFQTSVETLVLPKLTKLLPSVDIENNLSINNIILADPTYNKPGPIDIIIGADAYSIILLDGLRKITKTLLAQNTELG